MTRPAGYDRADEANKTLRPLGYVVSYYRHGTRYSHELSRRPFILKSTTTWRTVGAYGSVEAAIKAARKLNALLNER